jgi:hypothetical protein
MGQSRGSHESMQRSQKLCAQRFKVTACVGCVHKPPSAPTASKRKRGAASAGRACVRTLKQIGQYSAAPGATPFTQTSVPAGAC